MKRKQIAHETVNILNQGYYYAPSSQQVSIAKPLKSCVTYTQYYTPEQLTQLTQHLLSQPRKFPETTFSVVNETTLEGAKRLSQIPEIERIGVLNFASARNPGGGFLKGSQAQEESLARSSGLYQSLLKAPQYYDEHRKQRSCLYSDRMIYSPQCPVFRTDDGTLLEQPYFVDFITSPAPNAGAVGRNTPKDTAKIPQVLQERGKKVLTLAAIHHCDTLVLGAWGCGVFRNDPTMVAKMFRAYLTPEGDFWGRFKQVLFSVLDRSKTASTYQVFKEHFSGNGD